MNKKVVLITGASSGIGQATAKHFKKEGYTVYGTARRKDKMEKELGPLGIYSLYMDLSKEETIVDCVNTIIEKEGQIDVLINNAVYACFGSLEESPIEVARMHYEVNLLGMGRLNQLVIPHMRKHKYGKIVNISSGAGKVAGPFNGWYASTKFAIECLSDTMRIELKHFGIDTIIIIPGAIKTPIARDIKDTVLDISGNGIYAKSAEKFSNSVKEFYEKGSPPELIADTILKAIKAKNPKARYAAGHSAKRFLRMRRFLSDRMLDRMVSNWFFKTE
jgi:NAD(P)-dependent dehydrogenase (short-subunit alcohol dehydrogenase family)